jgi:hypothetical protein
VWAGRLPGSLAIRLPRKLAEDAGSPGRSLAGQPGTRESWLPGARSGSSGSAEPGTPAAGLSGSTLAGTPGKQAEAAGSRGDSHAGEPGIQRARQPGIRVARQPGSQEPGSTSRLTKPAERVRLEPGQPDCPAGGLPDGEPGSASRQAGIHAYQPGSQGARQSGSGRPGTSREALEVPGSPTPWQPGSEGNCDPGIRFYAGNCSPGYLACGWPLLERPGPCPRPPVPTPAGHRNGPALCTWPTARPAGRVQVRL